MGTARKILFLTTWAFLCRAEPVFAGGDAYNMALLSAGTALAFKNLSDSIDEFKSMPCLTDESKAHLENFQNRSAQVATTFQTSYANYVATVTKPMEGNGRCEGGFNSVAIESEKRRVITSQLEDKIFHLQTSFAQGMTDHFVTPDLDIPDNSEDQSCSDAASKAYDIVEANGNLANDAMTQFRVGTVVTERRFGHYTSKNDHLHDDCGTISEGFAAIVGGVAVGTVPSGTSPRHESTVTGEIKHDHLDSLPASAGGKVSAPGKLSMLAVPKSDEIEKSVSGTGEVMPETMKKDSSIRVAGGSEEMKVKNLLSATDTKNAAGPLEAMMGEINSEAANRKPASAGTGNGDQAVGAGGTAVGGPQAAGGMALDGATVLVWACGTGEVYFQVYANGALLTESASQNAESGHGCPARAAKIPLSPEQRAAHAGKLLSARAKSGGSTITLPGSNSYAVPK